MSSATTASPSRREPELRGQTVVVIGGCAGIGLETARRARAEGANVILTGRNPAHGGARAIVATASSGQAMGRSYPPSPPEASSSSWACRRTRSR